MTHANLDKNKFVFLITTLTLAVATLFSLQGCGGGGGGASTASIPNITLSTGIITEGNSGTRNLDFTVTLSEASTLDVSVSYTTRDDTATVGEDYTLTAGTLTIPANSTSATISVPIIGDTNIEFDETFNLEISNAQNGDITNGAFTVSATITTDDTLGGYYTGSASVNEGGGTLTVANGNIQVIADDTTLAIIDLTDNLVYITTISTLTQADFTATARVYKDGDFVRTANITANFTAGTSIDLTLTGTGDYTTGTVTLTYSAKNGVAPLVFVNNGAWQDAATAALLFDSNTITNITNTNNVSSSSLRSCAADSVTLTNVQSEQTGRIRSFAALINPFPNCIDNTTNSTIANGYITTFDNGSADDRILFVWFNDDGVHAASLTKIN